MSADHKLVSMKVHVHEENDTPVMYFRCARCQRLLCAWCEGAADDQPDLCNECWAKAPHPAAEVPAP